MSNLQGLSTERLILRQFSLERDLEAYHSILGEYEVGRWLPKGEGYTLQETERFLNYILTHWQDRGYGIWAVTHEETGCLLGHCGLNFVKDIGEVEVLYAFGKEGRGRGYGTEAALASLHYAFQHLKLDSLMALAKPLNYPSRHVMEKLGLTYGKDIELFNQTMVYYKISQKKYMDRYF